VYGIVWKSFPNSDLKYSSVQFKIIRLATLWTTVNTNVEMRNICTQNCGQKILRGVNSGQIVYESDDTVQWRVLLNPVQNLHTSLHFCEIHLFTFLVFFSFQVFLLESVYNTLWPSSWKIKNYNRRSLKILSIHLIFVCTQATSHWRTLRSGWETAARTFRGTRCVPGFREQ